jgi:hypothetical protein
MAINSTCRSGTVQRVESDTFNQLHSNLLCALHITFNGKPDNLDDAIGLMFDLKLQAIKLMGIPIRNGVNAAPCYEFVP